VDTKTAQLNRLVGALNQERSSYIPHWRDLNEHIMPRSARFCATNTARGEKRNQKIINNTATISARTLASGMMAGVTSPARPWFKLSTGNPDLDEMDDVKDWLHTVGERMREVFTRSNLYNTLPIVYAELGVYGTAAMAALDDDETIVRFQNFPIGSYAIANDERGRVDTISREWQMTVRQLVQKFGREKCSLQVQSMFDSGSTENWIDVTHIVRRNPDYDAKKLLSKYKKFESIYLETGREGKSASIEDGKFLSESGFNDFPVMCPRWSVTGEDTYGNCPGMDALGDIKGMQLKEKRKAMMIDKGASPPMSAPHSLKNQYSSLLPGDVTYLDVNQGQQGFQPVYEPNPVWVNAVASDIKEDERRIKRAFFEDLFLMLSNMDGVQPRNIPEIAERKEEKLLQLGPVMDRLNDELLDPLIDITFSKMIERSRPDWDAGQPGLIPVPPESMKDVVLKVEYTSVMAQALRMVGLGSIERFAGFVGNMAAVDPSVLDKWNRDETIDEYGAMIGLAPKIINSDEDVAKVREQRAQQQRAAQSMQMAEQGSKTAQNLSSADVSGDNALAKIIQNMQGATA
tara:strand:+ start:442418 stop:444139 length:1722 start_codon:yes stop_codon:yes gene_type:complete